MRCRLCGGGDLALYFTTGNRGEFRYYRCAGCRLVSYDLAGGTSQAQYVRKRHDPRDPTLKTNRDQSASWGFLGRHARPPGRLLDIGCGNGRLLLLAREAGFEVRGIELSAEQAAFARDEIGIEVWVGDFLEYPPGEGESYDVVVLRHVLEHLVDPVRAMESIRRLLRPGGHALLEFPNLLGADRQIRLWIERLGLHRRRRPPGYRPGHCHELSRRSFAELARRTGFEIVVWQTYSHKPLVNRLHNVTGLGNKARAWVRRR